MSMAVTVRHWVHEHHGMPALWNRFVAAMHDLLTNDQFWVVVLALAAVAVIFWLSMLAEAPSVPDEWIQPLPAVRSYYPV